MEVASEALERYRPGRNERGQHQPPTGPDMSGVVETLFTKMGHIYGNKLANAWAGQDMVPVKASWAKALTGFSREEVTLGLGSLLDTEWPPTLPEFIALCRPSMADKYFRLATEYLRTGDNGGDEVLFWAVQRFGVADLRTTSWDRARIRWTLIYDEVRREKYAGKLAGIPGAKPALAAPAAPTTQHQGLASEARLYEGDLTFRPDGRDWARKIILAAKAGVYRGAFSSFCLARNVLKAKMVV